MKWLKRVLLLLGGLVLLLVVISQFLPGTYRVERSIVIKAPAAKVYPQFADLRQWKTWGVWWHRDPGMTVTYSDPPTGVGSWSNWISKKEGSGKMTVDTLEPDESMSYDLSFPDFGMKSTGSLALSPTRGGVKLTWISTGDLGRNPMSRWFGLFLGDMIGHDFEAGLAQLKANSEKP